VIPKRLLGAFLNPTNLSQGEQGFVTSVDFQLHTRTGARPASAMPVSSVTGRHDHARRVLNVVVTALGLLAVAPLMLMVGILVKLTSSGPVIYAQTRVGLDRRRQSNGTDNRRRRLDSGGKPFKIYKFRTMYQTNGNSDAEVWASPDDPRVTPIGRLLRKYRVDELPQLLNVLRGEMNLVGPRPEQPNIFADMRFHIAGYEARQQVLPGITGWAQIQHPYDSSLDGVKRKVEFDLEYIARRSALEDLKIMLLTAPVVVFKRGAW
jgi:lipopolysaccharide/colanic/teichoic acid biosynthesis glycosyltransferase